MENAPMLNLNLNLGEGVKLSGPFCPERIDRTPPIFAACRLMGWENSSLAHYLDLPPQTIIRWTKGERRTPEYVVYLLTEGMRAKFEAQPPTSEAERTVWDCAKAFWKLSAARCARFDEGVQEQAMDFAAERQVEMLLETVEPIAEQIEQLERVRQGEPSRRFQKFVGDRIAELREEACAVVEGVSGMHGLRIRPKAQNGDDLLPHLLPRNKQRPSRFRLRR